jgi:hypothetical protein
MLYTQGVIIIIASWFLLLAISAKHIILAFVCCRIITWAHPSSIWKLACRRRELFFIFLGKCFKENPEKNIATLRDACHFNLYKRFLRGESFVF